MDTADPARAISPRRAISLAAVLFILGIKRMSSPVTARKGIEQAGIGMVIATSCDVRDHRRPQSVA